MTAPRKARRPVMLDAVLRYRGRHVARLSFEADPDIPGELREHLLAAMMREHRRGPVYIKDYGLDLWRRGVDKDPLKPWTSFTDVPRTR